MGQNHGEPDHLGDEFMLGGAGRGGERRDVGLGVVSKLAL